MQLVIDIGNSLVKTALFEGDRMLLKSTAPVLSAQAIEDLLGGRKVDAAIVSSVRGDNGHQQVLSGFSFPWIIMNSSTAVPVNNLYQSPETLGLDRLAAAIGAKGFFPENNVLVICAGTCLTFDFINQRNEYLGGSISPGLEMRLKALNHYTGRLPLEAPVVQPVPLTGRNTREAILSGVMHGMMAEIDGLINQYRHLQPDLEVVFSGGDVIFFDKKLKNRIFAIENIVLHGLNKILKHNVQNLL
ncbi:MAG: type III pantothenate kinase [Bacteroidales bacterium]